MVVIVLCSEFNVVKLENPGRYKYTVLQLGAQWLGTGKCDPLEEKFGVSCDLSDRITENADCPNVVLDAVCLRVTWLCLGCPQTHPSNLVL